jgi:peroxiredoxin
MLRFLLLFYAVIFISLNHSYAQKSNFSLTGKTTEIEDGSYLYFRDMVNGGEIDSALVQNNNFKFKTNLPEPVVYVMLFNKSKTQFIDLWLEEKPMIIDALNVDFKEATVTGSRNQSLFKELNNKVYKDVLKLDEEVLKKREIDFIKKYPDALVSAYVLYTNLDWSQNEIGELFSLLSPEVRKSSFARKINSHLNKDLPEIGESFFDFSIPDSKGEIIKISDLTEKLTLLQFWSSSCGPSRMMNNDLTELYQSYNSKGFQIISISKDTNKENWLEAIREDELSWPQLSNLKSWQGEAFQAYGVYGTPSNFLIDSKGTIIARNLREEELKTHIVKELN